MIHRAMLMAGLVLAIGLVAASRTETLAQSSFDRVLYVQPDTVHIGDSVYIGGRGYDPHNPEVFTVLCSNSQTMVPHAFTEPMPSRRKQENNWTTDGNGQFAGWSIPVLPSLVTGMKLPASCKVYADTSASFFATNVPGPFTILPANRSLDPCARRMCVRVSRDPEHVRTGTLERLTVASWPGASFDVTVTYPPGSAQVKPFHRHGRLNWDGHASLPVPVKVALPPTTPSIKAVVKVHAHLQNRDGQVNSNFTVIR